MTRIGRSGKASLPAALPAALARAIIARMAKSSPLDDPHTAAHAWARYRRLMRFMLLVTVGVVLLALAVIYQETGYVSAHFFIATALGIGFTMLLTSALMGLVFLSSGTGHDDAIENPLDDRD
jgi:uncharacterized membrane protein YcjF (UPF0283 family)